MEAMEKHGKAPGRPVQIVKKVHRLAVRLSAAEYFIVREKAGQAGMKPSAYLRESVLYAQVKPRITREELSVIRQLIGMANNLNQIARVCNREGIASGMRYFGDLAKQMDGLLNRLRP